jgi:hypothetical protein
MSTTYVCPMHSGVRSSEASTCPHCGMRLVPQGARHPIISHILSSPLHIAIMFLVMAALMAVAMMVR